MRSVSDFVDDFVAAKAPKFNKLQQASTGFNEAAASACSASAWK
jgi:hypothetical protein